MGEGAAVFLLKRLADAERDGDQVYAVLRGMGGATDGRGKGITAPNPVGQRLAVERAWAQRRPLARRPSASSRAHGTSTRVGDVVEVESLAAVFAGAGAAPGSIAARLGQVQHRPPQGRGRRRRPAQGGARPAPQVAAARASLQRPQPGHRLRRDAVPRQHRAARVGRRASGVRAAPASAPSASAAPTSTPCSRSHPRAAPAPRRPARVASAESPRRPLPPPRSTARLPLRGALLLGGRDEPALVGSCALRRRRCGRAARRPRAAPTAADLAGAPSAWRSTTATPPSSPTRPTRRSRRSRAGNPAHVEGAARPGHLPRAAARAPRSRSSTPARARSTSTCSRELRAREPIVAETSSPRPTG